MKKLFELLNLRKQQDGDFGVEIECEGEALGVPNPDVWSTVDDGSLRGIFPHGRAEWVFAKPLSLHQSIKEVHQLRVFQDQAGAKLDFSFRTSVHVHMNVQRLTFDQYLNTVYTYLLLENVLVRYCGNERIGNRFCLRTQDAEGMSDILSQLFKQGPAVLKGITNENAKYASINLAATCAYGSLEFRAMQGNLEAPYISTWLRALYNLRDFAMKQGNPQNIHDLFVRCEPSEFMEMVLGDEYNSFSYEDEVNDMRQAFSITLDLPYAYSSDDVRNKQKELEIQLREEYLRRQYDKEAENLKRQLQRQLERVRVPADDGLMAEFAAMAGAGVERRYELFPDIGVRGKARPRKPDGVVAQYDLEDLLHVAPPAALA